MTKNLYKRILTAITLAWLLTGARLFWLKLRHVVLPKLFQQKPKIEVYLALNDPYSYLLVQVLPELQQKYDVDFSLKLISENLPSDTFSAEYWHRWAWRDCQLLAQEYQLKISEHKPALKSVVTGQQLWQLQPKTLENAINLFHQTWQDDFTSHYPHSTPVINTLITNQLDMISKGFYLPGSLYCAGEWYWGLDRLTILEQRLIGFGCNRAQATLGRWQIDANTAETVRHSDLQSNHSKQGRFNAAPANAETSNTLVFYLSLRSPYSFLGWHKATQLAEKYHLVLEVRPILPLMMRGAKVSNNKSRYIFSDVLRQCQRSNIAFDNFSDPVGQGVENCYQLFPYAKQQGKALQLFDTMFKAVYQRGIDIAQSHHVKQLCIEIDLDYQAAIAYEQQCSWLEVVEENLAQMMLLGFWGVPCFQFQQTTIWGQDRLYRIEQAIIKQQNEA